MFRNIRRALAIALIGVVAVTSTGCVGKWSLTSKVYDFNKSTGSTLVQSIVFWALLIVPVYEITFAVDFFILNLIEAITGSNPLAVNEAGESEERIVQKDGVEMRMSRLAGGDGLHVVVKREDGTTKTFDLRTTGTSATLADESGVLREVALSADGGLVMRDASGDVVARRTAEQAEAIGEAAKARDLQALRALAAPTGVAVASR